MKKNLIRRILFFIVVPLNLFFGQSLDSTLCSRIDSLLTQPFFTKSIAAVDIYNLTAGKPVYTKNNKLLLHPASNMKILTSAASLYFLEKNYACSTNVFYDGNISGNTLKGNIYIVGGGDPLFSSGDVDSLVHMLQAKNIRMVDGNVYADISAYDTTSWGAGWMWDDDPSPDAPYISPLSINHNSVALQFSSIKAADSLSIIVSPKSDYFEITRNIQLRDSVATALEFHHAYVNNKNIITISGTFNRNDSLLIENISVLKPEQYFLYLFREKCLSAGIEINGKAEVKQFGGIGKSLGSVTHEMIPVLNYMNKVSDNLSAELMLRNVGLHSRQKNARDKDGIHFIDSLITLTGHDPNDYRLADGSGLSHYNLVTAELINDVLKYFYYRSPGNYEILRSTFPNAAYSGTLKNRMTNTVAQGNVYAKTGTLSGVSCLSGYIHSASKNVYSFSIFIQNFTGSSKPARDFQDKICEILAAD